MTRQLEYHIFNTFLSNHDKSNNNKEIVIVYRIAEKKRFHLVKCMIPSNSNKPSQVVKKRTNPISINTLLFLFIFAFHDFSKTKEIITGLKPIE
jgi:hypothetical protein